MDDYLCFTLLAHAGESEAAFKARLTEFWTHLLRTRPADYEKVYSEAVDFEESAGVVARRYMVAADGVEVLRAELTHFGIELLPVDPDDVYTRYEASSSEWFQIEH